MNEDLLNILDHIEREKGVKKELLFTAIESALVSAAKKIVGKNTEDITVTIDRTTGEIKVTSGGKDIKSGEFGRIAAQTAKQVIIQRIREAERDIIYGDFTARIFSLCTGAVHRFDKGNLIIDLGKTEAILPRKEMCPKDNFRQGDRVRALIMEVKKSTKGPQIILSRTHPMFIRRLFELEVPEIDESIVEIKCIVREAGDRTKLSVYSKEEKIDAVGACVGMRGQRVKDIVRELGGERIDIIKWSDDVKEYIKAALSPAEISKIEINKEKLQARVIVEDDQLSLAIGKHGQNVRLASKLTGWNIDIRSKKDIKALEEVSILSIEGIGKKAADILEESGFDTIDKIASAKLKDLVNLPGIAEKTAKKMIESAKDVIKRIQEDIKNKQASARLEIAKEKAAETERAKEEGPSKEAAGENTGESTKEGK
ncbi:MAG: transcription termination factor NusA [Candidatus Omnitrophica bacterium]|nr:transcription termination factor NusA [Candidatus Omnitrophota bacterium]MBU4488474.1 transcription termination factor NusA [Candidatus Omnitrophota bacterium]MCG2705357.1 transcription termination factor NusA [Candidatus Omnitrophota bacterium]